MQNSSSFCRTQEAHHAKRAAETDLTNVRSVATSAAAAWGLEAESAERREDRLVRRQAEAATLQDSAGNPIANENPDRGSGAE